MSNALRSDVISNSSQELRARLFFEVRIDVVNAGLDHLVICAFSEAITSPILRFLV